MELKKHARKWSWSRNSALQGSWNKKRCAQSELRANGERVLGGFTVPIFAGSVRNLVILKIFWTFPLLWSNDLIKFPILRNMKCFEVHYASTFEAHRYFWWSCTFQNCLRETFFFRFETFWNFFSFFGGVGYSLSGVLLLSWKILIKLFFSYL